MKTDVKNMSFCGKSVALIFAVSVLFFGAFYEYVSCFLGVSMLILLLYIRGKNGGLLVCKFYPAVFCGGIVLISLLSVLWAVDGYMALLGTIKLLPLPLFALLLMQMPDGDRGVCLSFLPHIASVTVIISIIGSLIPALRDYFTVKDRIAGTFQYPNTFAVFALMGLLYIIAEKKIGVLSVCEAVILLGGIILSGCRTVYLILIATVLLAVFLSRGKKGIIIGLSVIGVFAVSAAVVYFLFPDFALSRLFTISLNDGTLLCRLLYWKDALGQIIRHPLGLGYYGYYYTQGTFQRGVYYVTTAHNEFIQMFLDLGWLPGVGLIALFVGGIKNARNNGERLPLIALALHCFMDFDLQYIAVFTAVLLCVNPVSGSPVKVCETKTGRRRKKGYIPAVICSALCLFLAYAGAGNLLYYVGNTEWASIYPFNTQLQSAVLSEAETEEEMEEAADRILSHNEYITAAWDAKARVAFSDGDIEKMTEYKDRAIATAKYNISEYEDYIYMLSTAIELYNKNGDTDSMNYCIDKVLSIPDTIERVLNETDPIGWRIEHTPELTLGEKYTEYIEKLKTAIG